VLLLDMFFFQFMRTPSAELCVGDCMPALISLSAGILALSLHELE